MVSFMRALHYGGLEFTRIMGERVALLYVRSESQLKFLSSLILGPLGFKVFRRCLNIIQYVVLSSSLGRVSLSPLPRSGLLRLR